MQIKQLVFDLGGVLIDWSPRYFFKKIFEDETKLDYFLTEVCNMEWHAKQDAGRSFAEATDDLAGKFPEYEEAIRLFYPSWDEMFSGVFEDTLAVFYRLKATYPLYALTNWPAEAFPKARKKFDFLSNFQGIVVSGEEKMVKPSPEIYKILLQRYSLNANETVFIDD
ncbi:MAG: HAD family hydrolase [Flavobacteriales bacterium]|nr:MAG: HAD family hydrolase [Flavobacteriales bacterium]